MCSFGGSTKEPMLGVMLRVERNPNSLSDAWT